MRDRTITPRPTTTRPKQQARRRPKNRAHERQHLGQESIRVDERDLPREKLLNDASSDALVLLLMAAEELRGVGRNVALAGRRQRAAGRELNDFILRDGVVAQLCRARFPRSVATVRLPSIRPMMRVRGRREAVEALEARSCRTYQV